MLDIRLHLEDLNDDNFDDFVSLFTTCRESEENNPPDKKMLERLKQDGLSKDRKYQTYMGKIGLDWVSYVTFTTSYSMIRALPSLTILELFVREKFRNLGIGVAMLEYCQRQAKKLGCGIIEIMISNSNKEAQKFFECNRAIPVDTTYYILDPYIQIIRYEGKSTYSEFLRRKSRNIRSNS